MTVIPYWNIHTAPSGSPTPIDPSTLSWQVILDARNIIGVADGAAIPIWPDSSGFGRDAADDFNPHPIYRQNGSLSGKPLADFNVAHTQLSGPLPVVQMDTTQGFSCYAYYMQDTVDPNDGGGFNAQMIGGSDIASGWRAFAVLYPAPNNPVPSEPQNVLNSGVSATVGRHLLTAIWAPPVAGNSMVSLYYDGSLIQTANVIIPQPNTSYLVSGNGIANIWLKGRLGFFAFTNVAHSDQTRIGVETFLLDTFG